jgi:hypothetical protein
MRDNDQQLPADKIATGLPPSHCFCLRDRVFLVSSALAVLSFAFLRVAEVCSVSAERFTVAVFLLEDVAMITFRSSTKILCQSALQAAD